MECRNLENGEPDPAISQILSAKYIEHTVSKMDTLAGIAIKYGVEVADIKRMNGLVTDLQMYALKTLQIPLPGRHPPSPSLANGLDGQRLVTTEQTPPPRRHSDLFDSFQVLKPKYSPPRVSPAMSSLQGYYGIKQEEQRNACKGAEMAVCQRRGSSPLFSPPLSLHRKSKSVANSLSSENGSCNLVAGTAFREVGSEQLNEKFIRRRQKSELDLTSPTPQVLMEDNNSNGSGFTSRTGKGLALRPKSASRTTYKTDSDFEKLKYISVGMGESVVLDSFSGVRKSSSTSSLHDQETCASSTSSSFFGFSAVPKPSTGRKNKAALD